MSEPILRDCGDLRAEAAVLRMMARDAENMMLFEKRCASELRPGCCDGTGYAVMYLRNVAVYVPCSSFVLQQYCYYVLRFPLMEPYNTTLEVLR